MYVISNIDGMASRRYRKIPIVHFRPTPSIVIKWIVKFVSEKKVRYVYDLGCGDGRILSEIARKCNVRCVGYEIRLWLAKEAYSRVKRCKVEDKVLIVYGDMLYADISKADVIILYLSRTVNNVLAEKVCKEVCKKLYLITVDFPIDMWKPKVIKEFETPLGKHTVYVYIYKPSKSKV